MKLNHSKSYLATNWNNENTATSQMIYLIQNDRFLDRIPQNFGKIYVDKLYACPTIFNESDLT